MFYTGLDGVCFNINKLCTEAVEAFLLLEFLKYKNINNTNNDKKEFKLNFLLLTFASTENYCTFFFSESNL